MYSIMTEEMTVVLTTQDYEFHRCFQRFGAFTKKDAHLRLNLRSLLLCNHHKQKNPSPENNSLSASRHIHCLLGIINFLYCPYNMNQQDALFSLNLFQL